METRVGWDHGFASTSSPHRYHCSPFPPREQLLAEVVGGATVVVVVAAM
jgi:hypothetical protein